MLKMWSKQQKIIYNVLPTHFFVLVHVIYIRITMVQISH